MSGVARLRTQLEPHILSIVRIMVGLLYMEHGTAKLLGVPAGTATPAMLSLIWFAGVIEIVGGGLLTVGLFTRCVAFVMSGQMAIAYFYAHAPNSFFPLVNRGEGAILYCFIFLYFAVAGGGPWSLDRVLRRV